jgi:hypothetical protein
MFSIFPSGWTNLLLALLCRNCFFCFLYSCLSSYSYGISAQGVLILSHSGVAGEIGCLRLKFRTIFNEIFIFAKFHNVEIGVLVFVNYQLGYVSEYIVYFTDWIRRGWECMRVGSHMTLVHCS